LPLLGGFLSDRFLGERRSIFIGGIFVSNKLGRVLPSNKLGKITVLFIGSVVLLILIGVNREGLIYLFFYYSSIVLMFTSLFAYIYRAMEFIRKKKNESI